MQFYDGITEFIFVEDEPRRADLIFVPGGNYPDTAIRAAELYHAGFAPYIMPSGKYSIRTGRFVPPSGGASVAECATECDYLCSVLRAHGVPEQAILREDRATFTYENAVFSRLRAQEAGLTVRTAILCCQAFHARRSLMYYQEQFAQAHFLVCPVVTKGIGRENWYRTREGIDTVLGELERCGSQFHEILYAATHPQSSCMEEPEGERGTKSDD